MHKPRAELENPCLDKHNHRHNDFPGILILSSLLAYFLVLSKRGFLARLVRWFPVKDEVRTGVYSLSWKNVISEMSEETFLCSDHLQRIYHNSSSLSEEKTVEIVNGMEEYTAP